MKKTLRNASFAWCAAALATAGLSSCSDNKTTEKATTETEAIATVDSAAMMTDSARMAKPEGVMVDGVAMTPIRASFRTRCRPAA
ncbi:hypothetical protein [Hymenobacter cellulosilyticus]|uniref:Uncharacterized protein n=1 Tax=Hymenobacter cellulosilyticus TaxID=2932248 RepID=A0A8T9Q3Y7_9BACT|nr:hypothetical protein [Hymenobacter cellulosilyticus]UOQ70598.1 hypothetical protein MUN79_18025 [Hymenobacter cellulosilyticus]